MTVTEIRDTLTRLIDSGYGDKFVKDSENPWCFVDKLTVQPVTGDVLIEWESDDVGYQRGPDKD